MRRRNVNGVSKDIDTNTNWKDVDVREYFNYNSDDNDDDDDDDVYDKLIEKQIERLTTINRNIYQKKGKTSTFLRIFTILFIGLIVVLILFLALILYLEANDLNHPFYMHLLKLLQYVHYTSKGKQVIN
jgi:hypothetical protein